VGAQFLYLYHRVRASFLFIPAVLVALFMAAAFGVVEIDRVGHSAALVEAGWLLSMSPDGARQLVSTIAGATVTVTSLVFSLTLVTLTLASSQLGPRLISSFMADRMIQSALGLFMGVFVFALMVLTAISSEIDHLLVPSLSISLAVVLAIIGFLVLIVFIHHVARFIQADNVVARIGQDLVRAIDSGAHRAAGADLAGGSRPAALDDLVGDAAFVHARASGYVQAIDYGAATDCATANNAVIAIDVRPGQFVIAGQAIGRVDAKGDAGKAIEEPLLDAVVLGQERTMAQDLEFAFRAIVEVAVRALSPGVNDPNTAIACINQLGASLAVLLEHDEPPNCLCDDEGQPRVLFDRLTLDGLVDTSFDEIRQSCGRHVSVLIRLLEVLSTLAALSRNRRQLSPLARHISMIARAAKADLREPQDRNDVADRLLAWRRAIAALPHARA